MAILVLGGLGLLCAILLYVVARRFKVNEDPRIAEVEALLPGANCGACGFNGCHDFAVKCTAADTMEGFYCPGAGSATMQKIADLLGRASSAAGPAKIAVLMCNGSCDKRVQVAVYDGAPSCAVAAMAGAGQGGCAYGCLGCGDCTRVCAWNAIHMSPETGLPVIDESKCTACGQCAAACPRQIITIMPKGPGKGLRVWVACSNKDKGAAAMKVCKAACIACGKCFKACPFEAITIENNLSHIDQEKCRRCRKCVDVCPTGAILTANFPVKQPQPATPQQ